VSGVSKVRKEKRREILGPINLLLDNGPSQKILGCKARLHDATWFGKCRLGDDSARDRLRVDPARLRVFATARRVRLRLVEGAVFFYGFVD